MKTSIFIKTWHGGLNWLRYCLQSIRKYASEVEEVIVVSDESCFSEVRSIASEERVISVPNWKNGYIQQQWVKLCADSMTDSEQILFVDSDCIFYTPFTPEAFMQDGKPILLKTRYSELGDSSVANVAQKWRGITESIVKWPVEWEYMRRCPLMFLSSTIRSARKRFPRLLDHLMRLTDSGFSEFNFLGAFVEHVEPEKYCAINTIKFLPPCPAKQFWSWGGITPEIQSEIEGYLQ